MRLHGVHGAQVRMALLAPGVREPRWGARGSQRGRKVTRGTHGKKAPWGKWVRREIERAPFLPLRATICLNMVLLNVPKPTVGSNKTSQ